MRYCWLLLAGCAILDPAVDDTALPPEAEVGGLSATVRGLDEAPVPAAEVLLGSTVAKPDAGGATIFLDVPPGRAVVQGRSEGFASAWAPVDVPPHHLASGQLYAVPVTEQTVAPGGAVTLDIGTITIPEDALTQHGEPATSALVVAVAALGPDESVAMPGDLQALSHDELLEPIELFNAFYVAPVDDGWAFATPATLEVTLPPGSQAADGPELVLYRFDTGQGYWKRSSDLVLTGDVASGELSTFGWLAVGSPAFRDRACISGAVQGPDGAPVPGAEILLTEAGRFGSHRATADEQGQYCVVASPGASATLRVWAMGQELVTRFSGTAEVEVGDSPGACGDTCADSRDIEVSLLRSVPR